MSPSSQRPGRLRRRLRELHRRLVLRSFAVETIRSHEFGDETSEQLEDRLTRIEEVIAARWPRSIVVRHRLAAEIRASVAPYPDSFIPRRDFTGRRFQAASETSTLARQRRIARLDARRARGGAR